MENTNTNKMPFVQALQVQKSLLRNLQPMRSETLPVYDAEVLKITGWTTEEIFQEQIRVACKNLANDNW